VGHAATIRARSPATPRSAITGLGETRASHRPPSQSVLEFPPRIPFALAFFDRFPEFRCLVTVGTCAPRKCATLRGIPIGACPGSCITGQALWSWHRRSPKGVGRVHRLMVVSNPIGLAVCIQKWPIRRVPSGCADTARALQLLVQNVAWAARPPSHVGGPGRFCDRPIGRALSFVAWPQ
jgi:hypothetical protein